MQTLLWVEGIIIKFFWDIVGFGGKIQLPDNYQGRLIGADGHVRVL